MAVFKKLTGKKNKQTALPSSVTESKSVKQLDQRVGLRTYRDFFTLKNYWKAIDRKRMIAGLIIFQRFLLFFDIFFLF